MIRIDFEANGKTPVGYGRFIYSEYIHQNYRDIVTVENIVKKLTNFLRNVAYNDQCVTFVYVNDKVETTNVSRYWRSYGDKYNYVVWNGCGAYTDAEFTSLKSKRMRDAYLACADFAIENDMMNERGAEE